MQMLLLLLQIAIVPLMFVQQSTSLTNLKLGTFELKSEISIQNEGKFYVEEKYSAKQLRGIVKYKKSKKTNDCFREFFIDQVNNICLKYNYDKYGNQFNCSQCLDNNPNELIEILHLNSLNIELDSNERHLIGPARWLWYAIKNKHLFQMVNSLPQKWWPGNDNNNNKSTYKYNKILKDIKNYNVELEAYYPSQSDNQLINWPIRLVLIKSRHEKFIIKYLELTEVFPNEKEKLLPNAHKLINWDSFILKPLSGCAKVISQFIGKFKSELFVQNSRWTKFSFKSSVEHLNSRGQLIEAYKLSVAYDYSLKAMRIDLKNSMTTTKKLHRDIESSSQIFDFNINRQYHSMKLNSIQQQEGQRQICTISQIGSRVNYFRQPHKLEEVLLGSFTNFNTYVFLGKVKVRNQNALVFESDKSALVDLPFWFEQFFDLKENANSNQTQLISLVYVSDQPIDRVILMLEFHLIDLEYKFVYQKQKIEMFDFKWNLDKNLLELFSFNTNVFCWSNENEQFEEEGKIELQLESSSTPLSITNNENREEEEDLEFQKFEYFKNLPQTERNSLLILSLQKSLNIISSMIYNFESKIILTTNLNLMITFQWAKHTNELIDFVHLNKSLPNQIHIFDSAIKLKTFSFNQCLSLAAYKQQSETIFGYNSQDKLCYIQVNEFIAQQSQLDSSSEQHGVHLNAFIVKHSIDDNNKFNLLTDPKVSAELSFDYFKSRHEVKIQFERNTSIPSLTFHLINLIVHDFNDSTKKLASTSIADNDNDNELKEDKEIQKIEGFALVEQEGFSKKLEISKSDNLLLNFVSSCQSVCESQLDCKSYSTCLNGSKLNCILSKLRPNIDEEMLNYIKIEGEISRSRGRRRNQVIEIDALECKQNENCKIKIIYKLHCSIYIRKNINYFRINQRKQLVNNQVNVNLIPSKDIELCATICMENNINSMHGQISGNANMQIVNQSSIEIMFFCSKFQYIDPIDLRTKPIEYIKRLEQFSRITSSRANQIVSENLSKQDKNKIGYCIVPSTELNNSSEANSLLLNDAELFTTEAQLKGEYYFNEMRDISMRESQLNSNSQSNDDELERVNSAMQKHDMKNYQIVTKLDKNLCALACLAQSLGPCKSFDLIIYFDHSINSTNQNCYLNSMTINEVIESNQVEQLIEQQQQHNIVFRRHFEPKLGFLMKFSNGQNNNNLSTFNWLFKKQEEDEGNRFIYLFCSLASVILIALISGFYVGSSLTKRRLRSWLKKQVRQSTISEQNITMPEYLVIITINMENLYSLGLRIDEKDEQLRILSEVTEIESHKLASDVRNLLESLNEVQDHLTKTMNYLKQLDEQNARAKNVNIAANIAKIITMMSKRAS